MIAKRNILKPALIALAVSAVTWAPLAAQGTRRAGSLPKDIQRNLWPEQQLTPTQEEYKSTVIAMRDTVTRAKATIELVDRARRARNSPTMMLAYSRRLATDCERVASNVERIMPWAEGLKTDNEQFGEAALRNFRVALLDLKLQMVSCSDRLDELTVNSDALVRDEVYKVLQHSRKVIAAYEQATNSLSRTLKIRIPATAGS